MSLPLDYAGVGVLRIRLRNIGAADISRPDLSRAML